MTRSESPATLAYLRLVDLARKDMFGEVWLFALAWLAAGRMAVAWKAERARWGLP